MTLQQGFDPLRGLGKTQQDYTLLIVRDTPGVLDWTTPLINLFKRGPVRTTIIPPPKRTATWIAWLTE
jgi:hypothetical protein